MYHYYVDTSGLEITKLNTLHLIIKYKLKVL